MASLLSLVSAMALAGSGPGGPSGNMNGNYYVWSQDGSNTADPFKNGFNTDYASKGYEYFDVWAPEMATHYGEVFWTDQGNTPLPPDIVKRFDNKVMAIMGYEQDQVMVTPVGQPGVNPSQDVSVPINWAYNHHYMAWMTGKHSELKTVPITGEHGEDGYGDGWHGAKTKQVAVDLPSAANRLWTDVAPTSQMFSEGNGGESRKSFHGYPRGFAQLIDSPTSWHITPMQIDTRNRDCGVTPESIHNCTQFVPGPEPKQTRYGRGIPKGTNYSGILECPCNDGYGGDPQYYPNTNTKILTHGYALVNDGACQPSQDVGTAEECFASIAGLGVAATSIVNDTVSIASLPFGCSVTRMANGSAVATFNSAGNTACTATNVVSGVASTEVGVTLTVELTKGTQVAMLRSPMGEYCLQNKVGVLGVFAAPTCPTNTSDCERALAACEAFCMKSKQCNACSVDDRRGSNESPKSIVWVAIPTCGTVDTWAGTIKGDISTKGTQGTAKITMSGPTAGWFGVGFDAVKMADSPYTIVVNSTNVWEQKIGTCGSEAEHCPGDQLDSSLTIVSNSVVGGVRTVVATRPWMGLTNKHYTFSESEVTINFIAAIGSSDVFAYHKAHTQSVISLTNAVGTPSCVCDLGVQGKLCDSEGHCDSFTKGCVPAPQGSLLEQRNPTCNSAQYVGGLDCCHHGRIMLDAEDRNTSLAGPTLRYHMKWRFWFQEYVPAANATAKPSHYDLPRIYYQTEANAGEYDIPPAFSLPGNPVAGYRNWPLGKMTPGTSCTGTCPDGPDCECIHTIHYYFTMSNARLIYAGGHCHAPACISIELYENSTGTPKLLCRQLPKYGEGDVLNDKYDEAGYLALPPCLWGDADEGLVPSVFLGPNTPMISIKKNRNTNMGHYGEMASWQMRGVNF